jgi:hypothetical protein
MKKTLNPENYEILAFYPYPSTPRDIVAEYDDCMTHKGTTKLKPLFETLMDEIDSHQKGSMRDNKTTIKIRHIPSGAEYYLGYKDGFYRMGKTVYQELGMEITFDKSSPIWEMKCAIVEDIK